MILSSFCGVVTLQVGTAILAAVYILISALVIGINAFDYTNDPLSTWPLPLMLLSIFAILMVITGIIIFFCAYSVSRNACVVAVVTLIIMGLYWILLTGLSFMNKPIFVRRICHGYRCPETFWLANFRYRGLKEEKTLSRSGEYILNKSFGQKSLKDSKRLLFGARNIEKIESKLPQNYVRKHLFQYSLPAKDRRRINVHDRSFTETNIDFSILNLKRKEKLLRWESLINEDSSETYFENANSAENDQAPKAEEKYSYIFGLSLVGAICFFVGNSMFIGFTILVVGAFAQEIKSKAPYIGY